jgi:hypothetical protein
MDETDDAIPDPPDHDDFPPDVPEAPPLDDRLVNWISTYPDPLTLSWLADDAMGNNDPILFHFYNAIDDELTRLRALGAVVAGMYHSGVLDDAAWLALFAALADAGLIT